MATPSHFEWKMLARPRQLILTVTDRCNHFCDMCYYHGSLNKKAKLLSLAEYEQLSRNLHQVELLLISGGEPFLRKDLGDIIEIFYRNNGTRTVFIPSNGSMPAEICKTAKGILARTPALQLTLMMSLEGLHDEHDRIHGKAGAFDSVVETIRRLTALRVHRHLHGKPPLGVLLNTVVSNQNVDRILPLMKYVKDHVPVSSHTFSPMRGSGPVVACTAPSPQQFEALVQAAQPYFEHYLQRQPAAMTATLDRYALWMDLIGGKGLPHQCQAGNYIGVIEPDGRVRLCELTPVIGNLRDAGFDFERVWTSPEANALRQQIINCSCTHACFINASQKYYSLKLDA